MPVDGVRFLTEPEPARDIAFEVADGIRRIVANNPSPMAYHGTNTYLVETPSGIVIIDLDPDLSSHIAAVASAASDRAIAILLIYSHKDHCGSALQLHSILNAPIFGFVPFMNEDVVLDHLADGDHMGNLRVIHTPVRPVLARKQKRPPVGIRPRCSG